MYFSSISESERMKQMPLVVGILGPDAFIT